VIPIIRNILSESAEYPLVHHFYYNKGNATDKQCINGQSQESALIILASIAASTYIYLGTKKGKGHT
jgi:hypothetical protein